ncbi:MAG: Response regulator of zinc sigma-54-dependent two-component system [Labilithrix sp.]|nr:Response regulator of zinc sigma-54-dependent two-component system [Labilithrix sp.]
MTSEDPTRPELAGDAPLVTRVLVLWENGSATYFLRPNERVMLGRHSECEVVIDLPSVSRRHARLTGADPRTGQLAALEDLGGMNGVRVRGQRIPVNQRMNVGPGDVIELGGAIVVLHPPRESHAPSAGAIARAAGHRPADEDPMKAVERLIEVVAGSDLGVLLLGETGVGKTFAAEAIHARSPRANGPLLRLNCAALPEALLEGELFGYERGAFTGAVQAKAGLLESAAGGTVLLDEIGEMPLATQAKLLTVIETREVLRLGSLRPRPLDVRYVAATHRDLLARSAEGTFRLDLYYRLNGISIMIPPLRERRMEIPRFASRFLAEAAMRAGRRPPHLSNEALGLLVHHPFHGNIRELRNTMERAFVLAVGGFIGPEHLLFEAPPPGAPPAPVEAHLRSTRRLGPPTEPMGVDTVPAVPAPGGPLRDQMTAFERDRIVAALEQCHGNQTRAAEMLGMSRRALIARIEQYNLPRPRKR